MNRPSFICYLFFIFFAFLFSVSAKSNTKTLTSFLPQDTILSVVVDDFQELNADLASGPWGAMSDFPIWKKIGDWSQEQWDFAFKNGKFREYEESFLRPLGESLNGGIALGIGGLENLLMNESVELEANAKWKAQKMPRMTVVFDTSLSQDEFDEKMNFLRRKANLKKALIQGVIETEKYPSGKVYWLHHRENDLLQDLDKWDVGFCSFWHQQKVFVLCGGKDYLMETLSNFDGSSLGRSPEYRNCFQQIKMGQARIYLNFEQGLASLNKIMESKKMKVPDNPFGINAQGLIEGIGLDGLEQIGVQIDASDKQFTSSSVLFMSHRKGFLSFFSEVEKEVEFHDFIPAEVFSVSNARLGMEDFWPKIEDILKNISPGLHLLVSSQLQAFEDQANVQVRKGLFGSLGDQLITLSFLSEPDFQSTTPVIPSTDVFAISLKDPQLFDSTLRATIDSVSQGNDLFSEREHKGVTIRSIRGVESMGISVSYAITDGWLLLAFGQGRYLNQIINRMDSNRGSLWDVPDISDAVKDLPSGIRQVDYVDLKNMFGFLFSMMDEIKSNEKIPFKITEEDFGSFPYFMLGWTKDFKGGLVSKVRFFPFEE